MTNIAKTLIYLGLFIVGIGILLILANRFKIPFIGRLPGDILIKKENFTFYFPLATSILISIVLSAILYIVSRFHK